MAKVQTVSNIVPKVIYDIRSTQHHMKHDQNVLLTRLTGLPDEFVDFTFDNLGKATRATLSKDLLATGVFDLLVKQQHNAENCPIPYGIRFNKMADILTGASELASDENIAAMLSGRLPSGYNNSLEPTLPSLNYDGIYWGTSKPTFTTALMQEAISSVTGTGVSDSSKSSIFHSFAMPHSFDSGFLQESNYISNANGVVSLTIPHSGYSYGGDRFSAKEYKPQDCSSLFETQYHLPAGTASTADLYCAYQMLTEVNYSIPEPWFASPSGELVKLFDAAKQPQAGDALVLRKFSETRPMESTLGCGGHAGIVLGTTPEGEIITLAYNRLMPEMEGFGTERHTPGDPNKLYFYLRPNDTTLSKIPSTPISEYLYNGLEDLDPLVAQADTLIESEMIGDSEAF